MSEHKVEFTTTKAYLGKGATGMEFTVFGGDDNSTKKMGTLLVSRGAVYWIGRFKGKDKKIRKTWEEIRDFFEKGGLSVKLWNFIFYPTGNMRRKRARSNARNLFLFVGKVWSNYKNHQTRAAKIR